MIRTSLIMIAAVALTVVAPTAAADDDWTVVLRDGSVHEGTLIRVLPARYVLQTETTLFELTDDDIDPRTFADRPRRESRPRRTLSVADHYEELHRDGTATLRLVLDAVNTSRHALSEYRFGLAPWEQREIDGRRLLDQYGSPIPMRFDPPREDWEPDWDRRVQVHAELPVPVAPGEPWSVTLITTRSALLREVEEGYRWRHIGDYAEDRILSLKVRLPRDTELVRTEPAATATFEDDGFTYVMWRQFYRKGERRPLDVVFKKDD